MPENDSPQADATQCDRGHEFIVVKAKVVKKANTDMAQKVKCPGCGKVFTQLPTRSKDGAVYLPRHGSGVATEKVAPKEPETTTETAAA
jgi:uncharacterized Zn finger protein (UPF0148 family)